MSIFALPFQERSAASDILYRSRNIGIVWSGNNKNNRLSWAGGVFNNWLETDNSRSDNLTSYSGSLTHVPLVTSDDSNLLHLAIGYRHSNNKQGLRRTQVPEIFGAPIFIDTGTPIGAGDTNTWNYEISWRMGPLWLDAEYTDVKIDGEGLNFTGYYVAASWIASGEMRGYNHRNGTFRPFPVSRPVDQGGWGALELGFRYSSVDMNDKQINGGLLDVYTIAFNWWLKSDTNFSINWKYVELDDRNLTNPSLHGEVSGFVTRLTLILN